MQASLYRDDDHKASEGDESYWEASPDWSDGGTVVVFREDFQPLDAKTLEAFSAFSKIACTVDDEEADERLKVSPSSWEAYLAQYKIDNGGLDERVGRLCLSGSGERAEGHGDQQNGSIVG